MDRPAHRFSLRTSWDHRPSDLSVAIAAERTAGRELFDLTVSNPTLCDFEYDAEAILSPLNSSFNRPAALVYAPDPRGMRSARQSIVRYYAQRGAAVGPESLILTTSTSEAYSWLFRLLCDPGDEVLAAQPGYPLFDFLADLDDVVLTSYPLFYDHGWWIDFAELERSVGPRTRAILIVHPNNPTGHWTHRAERQRLEALCHAKGLALVVDEVFLDYPIASPAFGPAPQSFATGPHPVPTFVLSGISKIAALPQMKVAWIAAFGPTSLHNEALARLEIVADTFLSMNAPAQLALPEWLACATQIQRQIQARVHSNLQTLRRSGLEVLVVEAGWSAMIRLRGHIDLYPSSAALALLQRAAVIAHPAEFYGLPDKRTIVVSLITPLQLFQSAIARIDVFQQEVNLIGYPTPEIPQA